MTVGSQVKQTAASLKGVKATIDLYANQSVKADEKEIFMNNSKKLEKVIASLENRISALEFEEPQYKGF